MKKILIKEKGAKPFYEILKISSKIFSIQCCRAVENCRQRFQVR